jgi:hypothetical protein
LPPFSTKKAHLSNTSVQNVDDLPGSPNLIVTECITDPKGANIGDAKTCTVIGNNECSLDIEGGGVLTDVCVPEFPECYATID